MTRARLLASLFPLLALACWDLPPGAVPLSAAGEAVEILAEPPNEDVYEAYDEIVVQAVGMNPKEATQNARFILRNKGAEMKARFVSVEDASAEFAWDFSGRTIMTLHGRAWRVKEDTKSAPRRETR